MSDRTFSRFPFGSVQTVRSGIVASRERKVGFGITMKGKCQRGFAGMSTGPRVVKQRSQAPLILLDPPAFSIESCVWMTPQPRLKRPNLQIPDRLRRNSAQPDICRLAAVARTNWPTRNRCCYAANVRSALLCCEAGHAPPHGCKQDQQGLWV